MTRAARKLIRRFDAQYLRNNEHQGSTLNRTSEVDFRQIVNDVFRSYFKEV